MRCQAECALWCGPPSPAPSARSRPPRAAIAGDLLHHGAMRRSRKPSAGRSPLHRAAACLAAVTLLAACDTGAPAATPPITPGTSGTPREVNVVTRDYAFVPSIVDLAPGETVLLHVINFGLEGHEAVFGTLDDQLAWEAAEAAIVGAPPGPTPFVAAAARFRGRPGRRRLRAAGRRHLDGPGGRGVRHGRLVRRLPHPRSLAEGDGRAGAAGGARRRSPRHRAAAAVDRRPRG